MQSSRTNRQVRNANRSTAHRQFSGYIHVILDRVDSWKLFEDSPLQWLLEFKEHEHFSKVIKDLFNEQCGSIYTSEITETSIEIFLNSISTQTFILRLSSIETLSTANNNVSEEEPSSQSDTDPLQDDVNLNSYSEHEDCNPEKILGESIVKQIEKQFEIKLETEISSSSSSWVDEVDVENSMSVISTIFGRDYCSTGRYRTMEIQKRIVDNDVYYLSQQLYNRGKARIPLLIYAPPNSGKTILKKYLFSDNIRDTDQMFYWGHMEYSPVVITNMHHLIEKADVSIAVTPSRDVFRSRLHRRNIQPRPGWYPDMMKSASKATMHIVSNDWLLKVFEFHFDDIVKTCQNVVKLLNIAAKPSRYKSMLKRMKLKVKEIEIR